MSCMHDLLERLRTFLKPVSVFRYVTLGPYSLTWIKLSEKSAQDQIRIKENGSTDFWLKSVFTKEGSAEPKILKKFT